MVQSSSRSGGADARGSGGRADGQHVRYSAAAGRGVSGEQRRVAAAEHRCVDCSRLQDELDDLRDEVTYLKVKLRKEGNISRSDYTDVRDRLQDLRSRAHGRQLHKVGAGSSSPFVFVTSSSSSRQRRSSADDPTADTTQPRGTSSDDSGRPGDRRAARARAELRRPRRSRIASRRRRWSTCTTGNRVLIPAGSVMRGVVSSVDKATRTDRKGSLTVAFDQVTVHGRDYPMRGTVTQALESEGIKGEAARSAPAPASARSSAAFSAAPKARCSAS